jgi:hypothetical protein
MNVNEMKWPPGEDQKYYRGHRYTAASAICERGHELSRSIDPDHEELWIPPWCSECGARVLIACKKCHMRIPGKLYGGNIGWGGIPTPLPYFCENCGSMYPWATKKQQISEYENRLRLELVDDADYRAITEQLEKLLNEDLTPEDEKRIWERIKKKAGEFFFSENVKDIATSLMTKVLRDQLGI